ncbi:MAG: hypothetical protein Q9182_006129 [Xanthomendoza sp. 2 TL-2023]
MSKKQFKHQASSSRAASGAFAASDGAFGTFAGGSGGFGSVSSSPLSYVYEPPDLSNISEPNIVVAFKNLQKKDSITKAKALEDLQSHVSSPRTTNGVEDAVLEAWIKVYPRNSIDTARRVRQLAHQLQGAIARTSGRRFVRCMPDIVGPWLAGVFDGDKMVARAAQESVKQTFQTEEKMQNVWKIYLGSILQFCSDAVFKETVNTLSDERSVSPDDASAKYARVVAATVSMARYIIERAENSSQEVLEKHQRALDTFLGSTELWKLATHSDSSVRRAIYSLLDASIIKLPDILNLEVMSAYVLAAGLSVSQTATALDYSRVLAHLSTHEPKVWTELYKGTGKKSATKRLCQFLAKGSQGSSFQYWDEINTLLLQLPTAVLLPQDNISDQNFVLLDALRDGILNRDEPRSNQNAAWNTYLKVVKRFSTFPDVDRDRLIEHSVMPILTQYISPSRETMAWTVPASPQSIIMDATRLGLQSSRNFTQDWTRLSKSFIEQVQTSLPEQSKEFVKSQDGITSKASRWYSLQAGLSGCDIPEDILAVLTDAATFEIMSAIAILKARQGKPYGAASLITIAISSMPNLIKTQKPLSDSVAEFVSADVPDLILSPSGPYLVELIPCLKYIIDTDMTYRACLNSALQASKTPARFKALERLVSSHCIACLDQDEELLTTLTLMLKQVVDGGATQSDLLREAIANPNAPPRMAQDLVAEIVASLSLDDCRLTSLQSLQIVVKHNPSAVKAYDASSAGSPMLAKLISLADSPDEAISQRAKSINDVLSADESTDNVQSNRAILSIIRVGPETVDSHALSVPSLVDLAHKTMQQCDEQDKPALVADLLPDELRWQNALRPFFATPPSPSLAIMNFMSGALSLVRSTESSELISYDKDGHSAAFRLFNYTSALVQASDVFTHTTVEHRACVAKYLGLILQIASDNLSIQSPCSLWQDHDTELEEDIIETISQTQRLMASWVSGSSPGSFIRTCLSGLLEESHGVSVRAYYSSRAYVSTTMELVELHSTTDLDIGINQLSSARRSADTFTAVAVISVIQDPAVLTRTFNELLAGLTGNEFSKDSNATSNLIIFNSVFNREEILESLPNVPKQRLVFFVQHACKELVMALGALEPSRSQAQSWNPALVIGAELMHSLNHVLPTLAETYGTFWEDTIEILTRTWSLPDVGSNDRLPLLHASLRLHSTLRRTSIAGSNDDLSDAWKNKEASIATSMLSLLHVLQSLSDESNQPREIVNELLARQISKSNIKLDSTAIPGLFPALASESLALQGSAYEILHRKIPGMQENVSLEKALSKDYVAKLPEELLSLVLEAPTLRSLAEMDFKRFMPPSLRSYLLSWRLVFDHWDGASDAVKIDYINAVKEGSYIDGLLQLASDFLITSRARPVDGTKFDIDSYLPNNDEMPEKDAQWLLIHLYYQALKHLPTLSKVWWRDKTSRQTQISVESWTEKYISPLITSAELATIAAWAPSQGSDTDQPLTIKVSTSTREINASIPIDEQSMSLAITLPPSYPLSRAVVSGLHRVGVTEQKWRSWIITTQGVINFSDLGGGNQLIDGLVSWRKNVTATLKGQTECAICYSVVSADRQLPSKRCGTCKNLFHGSCLFKWFKSSNSSSCPLCRNQFSYS